MSDLLGIGGAMMLVLILAMPMFDTDNAFHVIALLLAAAISSGLVIIGGIAMVFGG